MGAGATATVVVIAAIAPFLALGFDGLNASVAATMGAGGALTIAAWALFTIDPAMVIRWRDVRLPLTAMLAAILAGGARILLPLSGHDLDPMAIVLEETKIVGFVACAIVGLLIGSDRRRLDRWLAWLTGSAGAYTLLALTVAAPILVDPPRALGTRFAGTLANANAAGCVFGIVVLLSLARVLTLVRRPELYQLRLTILVGLAVTGGTMTFAFAACAMTQSRVALITTLALALAMLVADMRRQHARHVPLLGIGGVVLIIMVLVTAGDATVDRFALLAQDAGDRWTGYRHLATLVGEAPLLGHGLGAFSEVNVTHLTATTAPIMWNWGAAHDIVLHGLIEGGLGVTAPIVLAWSAIVTAIVRRRLLMPPLATSALAAALILVVICAGIDVALNVPAVASLASLLLGALWGLALASGAARALAAPPRADFPRSG